MRKIINNMLGSWITTVGIGVPGLVEVWTQVSHVIDGDDATTFSWKLFLVGVGLLAGGIVARDGNKSSEDVKVKDGPSLH